jgi:multicomponent K+:H+ antiporter subunit D
MALLLVSGFLILIAFSRTGIRHFWTQEHGRLPALPAVEVFSVALLLAACLALTLGAGPVMQHANATALDLRRPAAYRGAVLAAQEIPSPAAEKP